MSVVYWRARAEQAEQKLKLCLRGIGLIGASAGLYNDANCPIPMVEVVTRVVDEIARLTRERDEARAAIKDAYGEGWSDGGHSAESLYAGYGSHDFDAAWLASDAMRAADKALATEAAQ